MTRLLALVALLVLALTPPAQAYRDLYPEAALAADRDRYAARVGELLSRGLWPVMSEAEQRMLGHVRVELPLIGRHGHPLDFYVYREGGITTIDVPVLSLRFIEDLSLAYAWRHVRGYTLEPIDEYVAMLKYREPEDFPGGRRPDPLTALGVPERVWEQDPDIDGLSLRFRNSAWAFILAHELGHVFHGHLGTAGGDPRVTQAQEAEADRFALLLLDRSETIPMGMILWFQASVGFFRNRADFPTEAEYRAWEREHATHPVNAARLEAMAIELDRAAGRSRNTAYADALRYIATRLIATGEILAEPDMQRLIARQAVLGDPAALKRR